MAARGAVAERLGRGLQSPVQRFESARRLGRIRTCCSLRPFSSGARTHYLRQQRRRAASPRSDRRGARRGRARRARCPGEARAVAGRIPPQRTRRHPRPRRCDRAADRARLAVAQGAPPSKGVRAGSPIRLSRSRGRPRARLRTALGQVVAEGTAGDRGTSARASAARPGVRSRSAAGCSPPTGRAPGAPRSRSYTPLGPAHVPPPTRTRSDSAIPTWCRPSCPSACNGCGGASAIITLIPAAG
jgi:hypothetical protein